MTSNPAARQTDPKTENGFLCDAMLGRLARWLRAAGHDTLLADGTETDAGLLERAADDGRLLLTRDRGFLEHKAARGRVFLLQTSTPARQAKELKRALGLDWLFKPFSRCVVDNTLLRPADSHEISQLPPKVRERDGEVFKCETCGRLYWSGSHHRRMKERLESWQSCR